MHDKIIFRKLGRISDNVVYQPVIIPTYNNKADFRENDPITVGIYLREYSDGTVKIGVDNDLYPCLITAKKAVRKEIRSWY